jgi:hypothetical protein
MNKFQILFKKLINEMGIPGSEMQALGNTSTALTGAGSYDSKIDVKGAMAISQDSTPKGNGKGFKKHKKKKSKKPHFPKTKMNKAVISTVRRTFPETMILKSK